MAKFHPLMCGVRLLPTSRQVGKLRTAHTKLQAAREAVRKVSEAHFEETGTHLKLDDVWTSSPKVVVPEAVEISSGVIDISVVRGWLRAGLNEARGVAVEEARLSELFYPRITTCNGEFFVKVHSIGKIRVEERPSEEFGRFDVKAFITFSPQGKNLWFVDFYTRKPLPQIGDEEPTKSLDENDPEALEDPKPKGSSDFALRLLLDAAEEVSQETDLTDSQKVAVDMLLTVFKTD